MSARATSEPLPIEAVLPEVRAALARGRRAVVQAPPGAGKSTVLPLALLHERWLAERRIVMLEPRRLAARSVAYWMAHLLGEAAGQRVGYRMRLESRLSVATRIEVVTEGVLTRMLQGDPTLEGVGCVIFDEFHERSLHADLGLALCLEAQAQVREDLRILVMSATLDAQSIAEWLGDAPIIRAEGQSFPVDTRYMPRATTARIERSIVAAVVRALREGDGDALVFLPGAGEIRRVQRLLEEQNVGAEVRILPLYGDLPQAEQELAIAPSEPGHRKVVLATSIAQTSLTIEGVRIVVDSGLARRAKFDPRSGMTQLVTTKVSRDAADQRRGRAGRLGPGVCYRLWAQETGRTLAPFTPPQILEADLCPLALELANWGVADPDRLRWLTPPPAAAFAQARDLLSSLGALDAAGRISAQGRVIAQPGVHPRLAHMLIKAQALGLQRLASEVAALLSERDVLKFSTTARAADVRLRLEVVRGIRDHLPTDAVVDRGAVERVRKLAGSWRTQLAAESENAVIQSMDCSNKEVAKTSRPGLPDSSVPTGMTAIVHADELENTGLLLALAYPDRVARSRAELTGRYQLSNGRGAFLTEGEPLAREEFLGVADLDAAEREARIYLAAPVTRGQIEHAFRDRIRVVETVAWDSRAEAVAARREERLDRILIHAAALEDIDPQLAVNAMLEGVRALGLSALPWDRETRAWRARVLFLRRLNGGDWPDVADAHLLASLESWLAPWLAGITRREHLARLDLRAALRALLTRAQQQRLDEWAPTHLAVPSGSRIALDYTHADGPVLAARLQELFGLRETPRIAGGRIPVIIQALSPAGRPVQVTRDLASFWSKGYHDVRKDLKGRYPKHYWPDDPVTAVATRKVRPPS